MRSKAIVAGVGMTSFGRHLETGLKALGAGAVQAAVGDAGISLASRGRLLSATPPRVW
jgi:acetyl-CoA acetyltransferase